MRKLRRKDREMSNQDVVNLLNSADHGILSTVDAEGQPYGVPLNFTYNNDCLYFHCALVGHKLDNLQHEEKVSFCVVGHAKVLPDQFTTDYESVIVFGVASEVVGQERIDALVWLVEKYSPDHMAEGMAHIQKHDRATRIIKVDVTHVTGKARRS